GMPVEPEEQHLAGVLTLPGGVADYKKTLDEMLTWIAAEPRTVPQLHEMLRERYGVDGEKALKTYQRVPMMLGLVESSGANVALTQLGENYLDKADPLELFHIVARVHTGML